MTICKTGHACDSTDANVTLKILMFLRDIFQLFIIHMFILIDSNIYEGEKTDKIALIIYNVFLPLNVFILVKYRRERMSHAHLT